MVKEQFQHLWYMQCILNEFIAILLFVKHFLFSSWIILTCQSICIQFYHLTGWVFKSLFSKSSMMINTDVTFYRYNTSFILQLDKINIEMRILQQWVSITGFISEWYSLLISKYNVKHREVSQSDVMTKTK